MLFPLLVLVVLLNGSARADCPDGCPARCPAPSEIQSDWVKQNFDLDNFWGTYYELAYHDNTQVAPWPTMHPQCQRSVKSANNGGTTYKDNFSMRVGLSKSMSSNAVCDLEFNITEDKGVFIGHWSGSKRPDLHTVSNTVIDVGVSKNGTYEWVLEFQCNNANDTGVAFAAINFYHKHPLVEKSTMDEMNQRARARSVGWVLDTAPGVTIVDQEQCVSRQNYPAPDAPSSMCGQSKPKKANLRTF